jgi:hypothetical protein
MTADQQSQLVLANWVQFIAKVQLQALSKVQQRRKREISKRAT